MATARLVGIPLAEQTDGTLELPVQVLHEIVVVAALVIVSGPGGSLDGGGPGGRGSRCTSGSDGLRHLWQLITNSGLPHTFWFSHW